MYNEDPGGGIVTELSKQRLFNEQHNFKIEIQLVVPLRNGVPWGVSATQGVTPCDRFPSPKWFWTGGRPVPPGVPVSGRVVCAKLLVSLSETFR